MSQKKKRYKFHLVAADFDDEDFDDEDFDDKGSTKKEKDLSSSSSSTQLSTRPHQHAHARRVVYVETETSTPVVQVTIHETLVDTTDATGLHLWPCSILLGAEIVEMGRKGMLVGLHVVELGAGTGLAGRVAMEFGVASVHFTDADPNVVASLGRNVSSKQHFGTFAFEDSREGGSGCKVVGRSGETGHGYVAEDHRDGTAPGKKRPRSSSDSSDSAPTVDVMELKWGDVIGNDNLDKLCETADLILGADCLYDRKLWDSFLATVHCLLTSGKGDSNSNQLRRRPRRFVGCHQLRNSNHTIQPLLEKWGLVAREMSGTKNIRSTGAEEREMLESTLGLFELTLKMS
jgi:predicted nicotinamide N-methyase